MTPLASLATPRLLLRASDPALAQSAAAFYRRNREAHACWNPPMPDAMFSVEGQCERLTEATAAAGAGTQIGWWLFAPDEPGLVLVATLAGALGGLVLLRRARAAATR